MPGDVVP